MPIELGYFTVPVKDLARGKTFYGGLFGWEFDPKDSHDSYAHVGNTQIPLGLTARSPGSLENLYFRVEDIHATLAKVRELGGTAEEPRRSGSGLSAVCRDDQGTAFSVWQPAPGL